MKYENEARVFFSAKSENESFARIFAAGFVAQIDPTIAELTEVKTAVWSNCFVDIREIECILKLLIREKGFLILNRQESHYIHRNRKWNDPEWVSPSWKHSWKMCELTAE